MLDERATFRRASVAVGATFAAHAFVAGTLGPWIPTIKADNRLDAGGLGIALAGYAIGLVIGTRLANPAIRALGGRTTVRIGIPALAGALALVPIADGLLPLAALLAVLGVTSGTLDVAMNDEAVAVERRFDRRVMSRLHGVWSVSVLVGAAAAAGGIAFGARLEVALPVAAAVAVAASFGPLRWLPRPSPRSADVDATADVGPGRRADRRRVVLVCAIAAGSFLAEGTAIEWSALLLREGLHAARGVAGLAVVAFSAGMAISRFAGDRTAARFGEERLVRIGAGAATVALASALVVGNVAFTIGAFAIVGLGLGPVVPSAFRTGGRIALPTGGSALAIVVTAGYVGSIVGPLLVGVAADAFGLRVAFAVPVAAAAVACLGAGSLRPPR